MVSEIKWQAFEHQHRHRSVDWYWVVWILAVGVAITAYLFNNLLFGILILLSAFNISIFASKKPLLINFLISERGISTNDKLIPYSDLESFWITTGPNPPKADGQSKILFKAKKKLSPYIVIPLPDNNIDTDEIKEYLLKHLKETKHSEPLSQIIIEKLGF